ncbi:hypothetical protein IC235_16625 [Hymenobacter sp. BT664]|uniref:Uncharacterized protein n=1 Tax=Hymenobacter montanus TaxID=2771359 RepID=A0A927BGA4_9BACT|nr:hypothetical protein [Hymenobacter montanus]MBD2769514.1 hypothetical protein [Hymenobacter montanus]
MNTRKLLLSLVLGIVFWLFAARFVRYFGPYFFTGHPPRLLALYAATVPLSWLFIQIAKRLGRLTPPELYDSAVVMTGVATLLDGLALTFQQSLYGESSAVVLLGAAWILWGVGCGLALAYGLRGRHWSQAVGERSRDLITAG